MIRKKTGLYLSRFLIVFLAIISQAIIMWILTSILKKRFEWVSIVLSVIGVLLFLYISNKEQSAVFKLPWLILILLVPVGGIVIYFTFGNVTLSKKQMQKFRHIYDDRGEFNEEYYNQAEVLSKLSEDKSRGEGIIKYLRSTTSLPVFNNTKTTYLRCGEDFFESLKEELKKAEKYVFLEYFIIEEGKMFDGIMEILKEKMEKGVQIYLLYDDIGSISKVSKHFAQDLRKKGINARKFFKFVPVVSVIHNNRDHRKIAVIDGKVGFMSGANIADEYINETSPYGRWLDNAVKIEGQATDNLVRLFIQLYNMAGGSSLDEKDFVSREHIEVNDGYVLPFGDSPSPIDEYHIAETVYLDIISRANKYLYITTPYLVVDTHVTDALKNAVKRGVDVRIIIPEVPDKKPIYIMTKNACSLLAKEGVKIYTYRDGFIHSKTFLSDGNIGVVGTVNLDYRSLVHHFECATLLCETQSLNDLYEDFLHLFECECDEKTEKDLALKYYEKPFKVLLNMLAPLI